MTLNSLKTVQRYDKVHYTVGKFNILLETLLLGMGTPDLQRCISSAETSENFL